LAYACWFWACFGLAFVPAWTAANLLSGRSAQRAVSAVVRLFFAAVGVRLTLRGRERIPQGACQLAFNHASYLDGMVALAVLPPGGSVVVKSELGQSALLRRPLQRLGIEFVERVDPKRGVEDTARLEAAVRGGRSLIVFPEGTNRRIPGLFPFRLGAFQIAARTGTPIVPGGIVGTRALLRADQWFPRRAAVEVILGPPITPESEGWDATLALRDRTRAAIADLAGEALVD
jgi:1-acyl-sn-glycerol-3-phosphate acyltransferase